MTRAELFDLACDQIGGVVAELKERRKTLRRDWEKLSVRERSAITREIKALETRHQELIDEIEMNRPL